MRLEGLTGATVDQERLEHVLDPLPRTEHALHACPPTPAGHDSEIARARLARTLAVDHDRHARREVRLADEELAAPGELYNNRL